MRTWMFTADPKKEGYRALMDIAFEEASEFSLLIYPDNHSWEYDEKAVSLYKELEPYMTFCKERKSYGYRTMSLWDDKTCFFKANEETKEILNRYNDDGFYEWMYPELFDDLCFYRERGKWWLTSIAHEGFIDISEDDEELIKKMEKVTGVKIRELA